MVELTLRSQQIMSQKHEIKQLKREIERLKAARRNNVPNTAAADMVSILDFSNTSLKTEKHELEEKNAALGQELSAVVQRNVFLEAELAKASHLLKQIIPDEKGVKQKNQSLEQEKLQLQKYTGTLQDKNKQLEDDKLVLQQHIHNLGAQQAKLMSDNTALHNNCNQWTMFSAHQGAEIRKFKEDKDDLHGSLVRKTWRLVTQKRYLDEAGITVKEFVNIDDDAIRAWAEEYMSKTEMPAGVGSKVPAVESQITPAVATFAAADVKEASGEPVAK